jgi:hypothetical protein
MAEPTYADLVKQMFLCGLVPVCLQDTIKASMREMYESWVTKDKNLEILEKSMEADGGQQYTVMFSFLEPTARRREPKLLILHIY